MTDLTPAQIAALKLAQQADLHPNASKKWTHENATVTFAKNDRWKERPQKIKSVTAAVLTGLATGGLIERRHLADDPSSDAYGITMAGKIWLLRNK